MSRSGPSHQMDRLLPHEDLLLENSKASTRLIDTLATVSLKLNLYRHNLKHLQHSSFSNNLFPSICLHPDAHAAVVSADSCDRSPRKID